jgi:hypothetical protein
VPGIVPGPDSQRTEAAEPAFWDKEHGAAQPSAVPPTVHLGQPVAVEEEQPREADASHSGSAEAEHVVSAKRAEESPLLGALRCFLDRRPADAIAWLERYDKPNQEVLLRMLPLAALLTEGNLDKASSREMDAMLDQLENLAVQFRPRADLIIDKMYFCRWIGTFGIYAPYPQDQQFRPGDFVCIYVELRNFASTKSARGTHLIQLASSAEIRDCAGNKVWPPDATGRIVFHRKKPVDESLTLRHDYFENYHFLVPDIPPGAYKLWIRVEDQGTHPARKAEERSLDFYVTNLRAAG